MKIENIKIDSYTLRLIENYRPPSKGGNTSALHQHFIEVENEKYSFRALGSQQWIFKSDSVSFEYEINDGYKNVIVATITTIDKNGKVVVRGNRDYKPVLRTAQTRMPVSLREQRD